MKKKILNLSFFVTFHRSTKISQVQNLNFEQGNDIYRKENERTKFEESELY